MKQTNKKTKESKQKAENIKLSIWKKILFSIVFFCAFFVLLELLLGLFGIQPVLYEEDPYVGFSSNIALFTETTGPYGNKIMVTAKNKLKFFNAQQFVKIKSADTYRIFCMGGSTTFGRPYGDTTSFSGWLRVILPKADPSRKWEVINAGGISYASYRVAVLMEELNRYEPDLYIIYSGQNEFLEQRTYGQIIRVPGAIRQLGAILSRTRTNTAVRQTIDIVRGRFGQMKDKSVVLPGEVETILENSIGPESYHRDDELKKQILRHYRFNLARCVDIAKSAGAEVIFVTPASNLRDCAPFKSEHRDGFNDTDDKRWREVFEYAKETVAVGKLNEVLAAVEKAMAIDEQYAQLHYLRGSVLWELGRYSEAKSSFQRALDEDICPLRALSAMRGYVVEVAAEQGAGLVDFAALIEELSEHSVPGGEMFIDHVHPTIEGHRQLALAILEQMSEQGIVKPAQTWDETALQQVTEELKIHLDSETHGEALRNVAQVFKWAGRTEEARKLALRATKLAPNDAEAHFILGTATAETGNIDESVKHYLKALEIEPSYHDAHHNLGIALAKQGKFDEAISHYHRALKIDPSKAPVYNSLGIALHSKGRYNKAIKQYRQALRLRPKFPYAHCNLANTLAMIGKFDEAIEHYRQALKVKPDYTKAHLNFGGVLEIKGNLDEAISHYRLALNINPDYAKAHNNLGNALVKAGKIGEAISHYRQALKIEPDFFNVHYNLSEALKMTGRDKEALEHLKLYEQARRIK